MKTKSKYVHHFKSGHWAEVDLGQNVSTDLSLAAGHFGGLAGERNRCFGCFIQLIWVFVVTLTMS